MPEKRHHGSKRLDRRQSSGSVSGRTFYLGNVGLNITRALGIELREVSGGRSVHTPSALVSMILHVSIIYNYRLIEDDPLDPKHINNIC